MMMNQLATNKTLKPNFSTARMCSQQTRSRRRNCAAESAKPSVTRIKLSQLGLGQFKSGGYAIRSGKVRDGSHEPCRDIKRYEEAMGSLSGRIGNLGDRIANVPNRIVKAGDKGKEAITGLFDMFGGK